MRVFSFDPSDYRDAYARDGYVHICAGLTPEFLASVVEYAGRELASHKLDRFAIKGKKEQSLYELPDDIDIGEVYEVVAAVAGLDRATITMSERHIQIYEATAAPEPAAHKDRYPSQVSVGLSIRIPDESRLVLYPYSHRETNPFNTSAGLRRHLQPEQLPENALRGAREVELDDREGDVIMFPGSTTWHLRRRAADALNLYLKFNDFGCDPLGEDPFTQPIRERTLTLVESGDDEKLDGLSPVPSRRLDTVSRTATRDGWREVLEARVFGEEPFGITEIQQAALLSCGGGESLASLARRIAGPAGVADARRQILRLASQGAIDLLEWASPMATASEGTGGLSAAM